MNILAYEGRGVLSHAIKVRTWSDISHVALEKDFNNVIEAWGSDGIVHRHGFRAFAQGHKKGTVVHVLQVPHKIIVGLDEVRINTDDIWASAMSQVGKKYDWFGILGYAFNKDFQNSNRLFCSEQVHYDCLQGGLVIQKGESHKQAPCDIAKSPVLKFIDTRTV